MKDLGKAKQLYWDYACSHFHMDREGVSNQYLELGGSAEYEPAWRKEYIDHWSQQISVDDFTAVNKLWHAHAYEALPSLLAYVGTGDGYANLWFALAIADLSRESRLPSDLRTRARNQAITIWSSLISKPIVISPAHKKEIRPSMHYLNANTPEEYVYNYAKRKLQEIQNI